MDDRRTFLARGVGLGSASALVARFAGESESKLQDALARVSGRSPEAIAEDESFWFQVQQCFSVDRSWIYLNNGGVSPSPRSVEDAVRRNLEFANKAPSHTLWRILDPRREFVRQRLASLFGCDPEEIAITRNASEALETLIFGFDLKPGDEVLACDQNYPRMRSSWEQRQLRNGIVFKTFSASPTAKPEELVGLYRKHLSERTRVMEVCQVVNLNGQIWPVKEVVALGRERGIRTIVDGAHGFGHFPFKRGDLGCDYYGTSLHKWLLAPVGTGMLYVKKERIPEVWPLFGAEPKLVKDIRKFEQIGTHPAALHNAIAEAVSFHEGLGVERKAARLRFLNRRWIDRLRGSPRFHQLTSEEAIRSCGLRLVAIEGVAATKLARYLLKAHGIIVTAIGHKKQFAGIRVTPNVYTLRSEIDRFADVMEGILENGLPG